MMRMIRCYNKPVNKQGFRAQTSRVLPFLVLILALPACTGILLGGGSGSGSTLGGDARTSSQAASDNAVSAAVRERLSGDATVGPYALRVHTVNRRVTLYGTVDSYAAREQAVRLAHGVDGVSSVDNRIRVDTQAQEY